jgi:O-acetyl-ADP-ribose deacetylase (regulator of RNase III)
MKRVKDFGRSLPREVMRLSLCDTNPEMTDAWLEHFYAVDEVEILCGNMLEVVCDALVSPANSFGDMSGGVDKAIDDFYRGKAQETVTQAIQDQFLGELPVGMALVVPMPSASIRYIIAAPTMRVPTRVENTINAYLAMRAVLVAALIQNRTTAHPIRHVVFPGLCTGVGGMPYGRSAQQMRVAFDNILRREWEDIQHPAMAPFAFGPMSHRRWRDSGGSEQ